MIKLGAYTTAVPGLSFHLSHYPLNLWWMMSLIPRYSAVVASVFPQFIQVLIHWPVQRKDEQLSELCAYCPHRDLNMDLQICGLVSPQICMHHGCAYIEEALQKMWLDDLNRNYLKKLCA